MKRHWTTDELIDEWTLSPDEELLLRNKAGATRLGFAVLLKYFQHEGRFPERKLDVPAAVVAHLAKLVRVTPEHYLQYTWSGRTIKTHRAQIRAALGFRVATVRDAGELVMWLNERVLAHEHRPERLEDSVRAECRSRGLEPPSPDRISRIIRSALRTYERAFFERTWTRLSAHARGELNALVASLDDQHEPTADAIGSGGHPVAEDGIARAEAPHTARFAPDDREAPSSALDVGGAPPPGRAGHPLGEFPLGSPPPDVKPRDVALEGEGPVPWDVEAVLDLVEFAAETSGGTDEAGLAEQLSQQRAPRDGPEALADQQAELGIGRSRHAGFGQGRAERPGTLERPETPLPPDSRHARQGHFEGPEGQEVDAADRSRGEMPVADVSLVSERRSRYDLAAGEVRAANQARQQQRVKGPDELTLHDVRADPGPTGLDSVLLEIAKLTRLRQIGLPADLFADVTPQVLQTYRNRAAAEPPRSLRAHPEPIRLTLLAALCWARSQEVTDGLVTLLIALVHRMGTKAERRVEREYLEQIRQVAGKTGILFRVAEAAVTHPDGIVREVIYPAAGGEKTLADLVKEYKATGPRYREHVYVVMKQSFSTYYRRMLPRLLEVLDFRSNNDAHQPLIRALTLIRTYMYSGMSSYPADEPIPLEGVVRPTWRELVIEADADGTRRVLRLPYELCALQSLRDGLRSKEVWVIGARRFRNPEEDLPVDFDVERTTYYAALRQPLAAEEFVAGIRAQLSAALAALEASVARNRAKGVRILKQRGGWIQVSPFPPLTDPPMLGRLKQEIGQRWPMTGLLDIFKEAALRTGFTDAFATLATREALDRETLQKRLLLCLYGLGTNTGLRRLASADPHTTYSDLRYVRRRYINKELLIGQAPQRAQQRQQQERLLAIETRGAARTRRQRRTLALRPPAPPRDRAPGDASE